MAHKKKYSWLALALVAVILALVGYLIIYRSEAANADINGDGSVGILDLSILASHYGQTGQGFATGDLNGDGSVTILDLSVLAANWGTGTSQPPAFMSYPVQTTRMSVSGGSNVVISNKSFRGISGSAAITVSGATNVYIHDVDFDSNSGDIYLVDCSGQIRIENIRARNTGAGTTSIGSGLKNVIQLSRTWDNGTGGIRHLKSYGGPTEDAISVYKSGGLDDAHRLIIEDVHIESPLPSDSLAWTSTSGTGINMGDAGGHDIEVRNSTLLNPGAVGLQMHVVSNAHGHDNIVYGAQRALSNVGLSQWTGGGCTTPCTGNEYFNNRVWWKNASGSFNCTYNGNSGGLTLYNNTCNDATIDPNSLKVVL